MKELRGVILSLYPGLDLLGRAFGEHGWCVVRGPDILWGQRTEDFHGVPHQFDGVIAGTPCIDYSKARRDPPTGKSDAAILEFSRLVTECWPRWWLLENVPGVPDLAIEDYCTQRFNVQARDCGSQQNRLRTFQFGSFSGQPLVIRRPGRTPGASHRCCMAREGQSVQRRDWADFCELQGLPRDFALPGWSLSARYRMVGNGVPLAMGRVVAAAISLWPIYPPPRLCACQCGREVQGKQIAATAACRKRLERRRKPESSVSPADGG